MKSDDLASDDCGPSLTGASSSPGLFARTSWTMIRLAIAEGKPGADQALNELGTAYYQPVRKCIHRWLALHAQDTERTDDLCNGFFHKLLRLNKLAAADPLRGKFRTFLRTQLEGFLFDQINRFDHAQKRDARLTHSHDATDEDGKAIIDIVDSHSPLEGFDREFTRTMLSNTMEHLRRSYERKGKATHFDVLSPYLTESEESSLEALAAKLCITYNAIRSEAKRLRMRWREAINKAVADTLDNPTEENIKAELIELMGYRKAERRGVQRSANS